MSNKHHNLKDFIDLAKEPSVPPFDDTRENDTEKAEIELEALANYYRLRKEWSEFIKLMIAWLIIAQILLLIGIGSDALTFWGNEKLTWIFYTETFLQIVGLAYIVVKFLFTDPRKK